MGRLLVRPNKLGILADLNQTHSLKNRWNISVLQRLSVAPKGVVPAVPALDFVGPVGPYSIEGVPPSVKNVALSINEEGFRAMPRDHEIVARRHSVGIEDPNTATGWGLVSS